MLSTVRLLTAAFVLSQACTIAQLSAHDQNLGACKDGWSLCDRTTLTPTELAEVSRARHFKNIADCRSGLPSCDQSQLTPSEANSVAVANYQRNLSDCKFGLESCDHSKLNRREAIIVSDSERERTGPVASTTSAPATSELKVSFQFSTRRAVSGLRVQLSYLLPLSGCGTISTRATDESGVFRHSHRKVTSKPHRGIY